MQPRKQCVGQDKGTSSIYGSSDTGDSASDIETDIESDIETESHTNSIFVIRTE